MLSSNCQISNPFTLHKWQGGPCFLQLLPKASVELTTRTLLGVHLWGPFLKAMRLALPISGINVSSEFRHRISRQRVCCINLTTNRHCLQCCSLPEEMNAWVTELEASHKSSTKNQILKEISTKLRSHAILWISLCCFLSEKTCSKFTLKITENIFCFWSDIFISTSPCGRAATHRPLSSKTIFRYIFKQN